VQLFLSLLGVPHDVIDVDLAAGEHKSPTFLARNPFGQVPVLEDGELTFADSNAILTYLADRYDAGGSWYPMQPEARARVQRWLSVAAGELKSGPADARLVTVFGAGLDHERAKTIATRLFDVFEAELAIGPFLVGDTPTIADIATYAYVAHAPEGGVSLDPYPRIRAWLARVESLDQFVPMTPTAVGLAA
jgi:glutathione S-transferase